MSTSSERLLKSLSSLTLIVVSFGILRSFLQNEQKQLPSKTKNHQSDMDDIQQKMIEPNSGLSYGDIQKMRRIYQLQKEEKRLSEGAGWDFWDERVHIENLFCTRFNYLILCYSLFVAAFATISGITSKLVILGVGFVVLSMITIFLIRAWEKLDILLKIIYNLNPSESNGLTLIDSLIKKKISYRLVNFLVQKYNRMAGVWLPIILCVSFLIGFIAILIGWWEIPQTISYIS